MLPRNIAVAIPARNEEERILPCLEALNQLIPDRRIETIGIVVLANNCADETAALARSWGQGRSVRLTCLSVELPPDRANAGWARRLALDAAARQLRRPTDALLCTDADTLVAPDWLTRTLDHFDLGYDAVAGFATLRHAELKGLPRAHRERLARIRRYERAFDYLRGRGEGDEPWPRHFYEGGASIALTLGSYLAIGGAPTPPVGEDKALFGALRAAGKRIRHPRDVRVRTSCRLDGRANGGAADTLARWGLQGDDDGLWGLRSIAALLEGETASCALTFAGLEGETQAARRLVSVLRAGTDTDERADPAPHQLVRRQTSSR